jgi:hypothetical protein
MPGFAPIPYSPESAAKLAQAIAAVLRPLAPKGGRVKDRETSRIAAKGTGYSPAPSTKVDKVTEIAGDEAQPEGTIAWRVYRCADTKMPSELQVQKFQSSSSVLTALPITYDEPEPEKKSWFSSALGLNADRIAGFTSVSSRGNNAS